MYILALVGTYFVNKLEKKTYTIKTYYHIFSKYHVTTNIYKAGYDLYS